MPESAPTAPPDRRPAQLWAPHAWLPGGWQRRVLLRIGADGRWVEVQAGVAPPPEGAQLLDAALLPGLVDAHSHAFQRAFAGLAERRETEDADDFWSWRERMYGVGLRVAPDQLRAIAAQLYAELLQGGYTHVCEFHYLQHRPDGRPYDDADAMAWALADAAADVGIGLTLLPGLYERAGFAQPALRAEQRRFAGSPASVWASVGRIEARARADAAGAAPLNAGVAVHSLRAAAPASIHALRSLTEGFDGPIHIHVAEQASEVDDCLAATGARPIEWLSREGLLDARWQLVHATHAVAAEIDAVARSGAGVVLCPGTEANLGDGLCDLPGWLAAGVPLALGSDSQVSRCWREELRWLDYCQRLALRRRNVAAAPTAGVPSTAASLFDRMLAGGAAAAGLGAWGLQPGARADALVADAADTALLGIPADRQLDAMVFSSPSRPFRRVMVRGRWVWGPANAAWARAVGERFRGVMEGLWGAAQA